MCKTLLWCYLESNSAIFVFNDFAGSHGMKESAAGSRWWGPGRQYRFGPGRD